MLRLAAVLTAVVLGGEIYGVKMADTVTVEGKQLKLNGMGLRTKAFFKVYVAGLYVENPITDANVLFATDAVRRVDLQMKRDVGASRITQAIRDGIERNSKDQLPSLQARLDRAFAGIPDLKEGQTFTITYVPGKGTIVQGGTHEPVTIEGRDFGEAVFMTWLGKNPVDDDLKKGLLGGK